MILSWRNRVVLTNAVFSRRRLHLISIDFGKIQGAFQEVYDKGQHLRVSLRHGQTFNPVAAYGRVPDGGE